SKNLKRIFFTFLWKMPLERLHHYSKDFVQHTVLPEVHPELIREIERHKKEKRITVLNTASPDIYPRYIAEELGFDLYRATPFILTDPLPLFIYVNGPNNKRTAKLFSMKEILPENIQEGLLSGDYSYTESAKDPVIKNSWAYSDSPADLPMLYLSEHPVLIKPLSSKLISLQKTLKWEIIIPEKSLNRFATYGRMLRQLLGIYSSK
ncbi:MAG: haloacid dehalogenase-like hydrolase, partial [Spirochaetia bacterium]|nr:haloacid dehalogenase-like hydrolase [Spirochaetia bacterium]